MTPRSKSMKFAQRHVKKKGDRFYLDFTNHDGELYKSIRLEGGVVMDGKLTCDFALFDDDSLLVRYYEEEPQDPVAPGSYGCDGYAAMPNYKDSIYRDAVEQSIEDNLEE